MQKKILVIKKSDNKHCFVMHRFNCEECYDFRFKKPHVRSSIAFLGIIIASLFTLLPFLPNMVESNSVWATTGGATVPMYMISTRDGSDPPEGVKGVGYNGKA